MTESQWLAHDYPPGMVHFLKGATTDRKLRLFACACARWTWDGPPDVRCLLAVETAEQFADGQATAADLAAAYRPARRVSIEWGRVHPDDPRVYVLIAPGDAAARSAFGAALTGSLDAGWSYRGMAYSSESPGYAALAGLARCVFGNPFCPVPLSPGWCSPAVVALARAIYDGRAFERLPELAAVLSAAGCDDPDILDHCRGGLHARGCWVIDLLLGLG